MEEVAARWRVFQRSIQEIKAQNADTDFDELQVIIDSAVEEVRRDKSKADAKE